MANKYTKVVRDNMPKWADELRSCWAEGKWTDCSLDEYCAYKTWVISQGEDFFVDLQKKINKEEGVLYDMNTIKHDSWVMYLESIGITTTNFLQKLYENINADVLSVAKEGGIA